MAMGYGWLVMPRGETISNRGAGIGKRKQKALPSGVAARRFWCFEG
jgi:hypothetical protein